MYHHIPRPVDDESLEKFKKVCEKEGIKYETDAEYRESANNLVNFVDLLLEMSMDELARKKRLEKEPKGFAMAGEGRTCRLCRSSQFDQKMWFDKWGMKCVNCQDALIKKLIPGYVFQDDKNEKHITGSELSRQLDIHPATIRKLVRQEKLKARVIPNTGTLVFLRKENPNLARIIEAQRATASETKKDRRSKHGQTSG